MRAYAGKRIANTYIGAGTRTDGANALAFQMIVVFALFAIVAATLIGWAAIAITGQNPDNVNYSCPGHTAAGCVKQNAQIVAAGTDPCPMTADGHANWLVPSTGKCVLDN